MKYSTALLAAMASLAAAHMEMVDPPPFRSKNNPNADQSKIDYSYTAPLSPSDPASFPCKGYHADLGTPAGASVATWEAGSQQKMTIGGGAAHNGGSCQASLSYDQGATFTVIKSYIGNCPLSGGGDFSFTVPSDAPSGEDVLFAWTWFNNVGNREMYMNCAAVTITGGGSGISGRPGIFVANVAQAGTCSTVEGSDVLFPDPGPDVENSSSKTAPPSGDCPAGNSGGSPPPQNTETPEDPVVPTTAPAPVPTEPASTVEPEPVVPITTSIPGGVFLPEPTPTTMSTVIVTSAPAEEPTSTDAPAVPPATTTTTAVAEPVPTEPVTEPNPPQGDGSIPAAGTACSNEGAYHCDGTRFARCASGMWSAPIALAAGTTCQVGESSSLWRRGVKGVRIAV